MTEHIARVSATVRQINSTHGYGAVRAVYLFLDGRIEAVIIRPYHRDVIRRGHIADGKVFFCGTRRKIAEVGHVN